MFSLQPELSRLRDEAVLDDATAARLIALEDRDVVSVYSELRFLTWAGVMLIVAGVGVIVTKNFDRIGPLAIAAAIAAVALGCYAYAEWRRRSAKRASFKPSLIDDYVLLLGALLVSADVGFIEHQWHLLGNDWQRHFLFLAVVHAVGAYFFNSRMLLSLSIAALAAFLGIERRFEMLFASTVNLALRSFLCAAILYAWRTIDARIRGRVVLSRRNEVERGEGPSAVEPFTPVFDHFATNLAFWGALILGADKSLYVVGCLLALVFAYLSFRHGQREREELFVIYAWVYGVIAVNLLVFHILHEPILITLFIIASTTAGIVGLFVIHMRMREARA